MVFLIITLNHAKTRGIPCSFVDFNFSQCPKELVKHWAEKVTPLYCGNPKQQGTKS
jgi:hypothetical protein